MLFAAEKILSLVVIPVVPMLALLMGKETAAVSIVKVVVGVLISIVTVAGGVRGKASSLHCTKVVFCQQ